jgi:tetratricopeptide (TPR) repeat protein
MDERWQRIEDLFHRALAAPDADRRALVAAEAGADPVLAADVLALLEAHGSTHTLLDAPRVADLPSGMRIGPYALDRILGAGGMATVYLAHRADQQFDRHVAIKLLNQGLAGEISGGRFQLERQILARLEHPHIASLLDAGATSFGQPYIVMEWVDGVPLDRWMREHRPSRDEGLSLWLQLADAVGYAHRNLIIHRDLKPSNVIVDAGGAPKLLDFGIAKLLQDDVTQTAPTRTQHFTPQYASPEQIHGQAVTTSTDIYGLGLLLFEITTGTRPFGAADRPAHEYADAVLHDEIRIPPDIPADLAAILRMALRKEPERRYTTADQFAEDVRRFRRGLPVAAQPETWRYRARTFVRRHRVAVTVAAVVAAVLVTVTTVAIRQARIADEQRARAEQVTSFVTGFLGATSSGPNWDLHNKGVALRVVELADRVAERVGVDLGTQPEAEATLRSVLALTYYQMGEIQKSRDHAARALQLYDRLYPQTDPRRFSVELVQASVENALGQFAAAEARAQRIGSTWRDPTPADQAVIGMQLGLAQLRLGKVDLAEQTFATTLVRVEAALGANHPSVGLLASYLALAFLERGQFERAASELERAAAISRATFKDTSMPRAWALVNLANAYRFLGRNDEVLRTAEESYEQFKGALGEGHYSTVHPLAFIAYAKALRGDPDAEAVARKAVAVQASLPGDHYERAVGLSFLGFVLMHEQNRGGLPEARAVLERALELRRKAFAAPNWRIAETAGWLGEAIARQGDRAAGRPLLEESAAMFTTLYGTDNPRAVDALARLARWR